METHITIKILLYIHDIFSCNVGESVYKYAMKRNLFNLAEIIKEAELEQLKNKLKKERELALEAKRKEMQLQKEREEKHRQVVAEHHKKLYANYQAQIKGKAPIKTGDKSYLNSPPSKKDK